MSPHSWLLERLQIIIRRSTVAVICKRSAPQVTLYYQNSNSRSHIIDVLNPTTFLRHECFLRASVHLQLKIQAQYNGGTIPMNLPSPSTRVLLWAFSLQAIPLHSRGKIASTEFFLSPQCNFIFLDESLQLHRTSKFQSALFSTKNMNLYN